MVIKIAPSILSADFSKLGDEVQMLEKNGADYIHIDVMDGHFVPNLTMGPMIVKSLRDKTSIPFDVHLMMDNPMDFVDEYIDAGADNITLHAEVLPHLHRSLNYIKKKNINCAVALNPSTPLTVLDYVLDELDMVLIMTVNPGFGGQSFIPAILNKINDLRNKLNILNRPIDIEVDGGISLENIKKVVTAGANIIVVGSSVFNSKNPDTMLKALKAKALEASI